MTFCKFKHSIDELVQNESEMNSVIDTLLYNGEYTELELLSVESGINVDQIKSRLFFLEGRNGDLKEIFLDNDDYRNIVRFNETYQRYKQIIRGEKNISNNFFLYTLTDDEFLEVKNYNLQVVDAKYLVNFEEEKDVLFGILYMYSKADYDKITESNRLFLKKIFQIYDQNPDFITDDVAKLYFEFKLKDFGKGNLFDKSRIDFIPFIESNTFGSKYRDAYEFYRTRSLLREDPIGYLAEVQKLKILSSDKTLTEIVKGDIKKILSEIDIPTQDVKRLLANIPSITGTGQDLDIIFILQSKFKRVFEGLDKINGMTIDKIFTDYIYQLNASKVIKLQAISDLDVYASFIKNTDELRNLIIRLFDVDPNIDNQGLFKLIYEWFIINIADSDINKFKNTVLTPETFFKSIIDLNLNTKRRDQFLKFLIDPNILTDISISTDEVNLLNQFLKIDDEYFHSMLALLSEDQMKEFSNLHKYISKLNDVDIILESEQTLRKLKELGINFNDLSIEARDAILKFEFRKNFIITEIGQSKKINPLFVLNKANDVDYFNLSYDSWFGGKYNKSLTSQLINGYVVDSYKFERRFNLPVNTFSDDNLYDELAFKNTLKKALDDIAYDFGDNFDDWYKVEVKNKYLTAKLINENGFVKVENVRKNLGLPVDTFASKQNWTIPEFKNRLREALIENKDLYYFNLSYDSWFDGKFEDLLTPDLIYGFVVNPNKYEIRFNLPVNTFIEGAIYDELDFKEILRKALNDINYDFGDDFDNWYTIEVKNKFLTAELINENGFVKVENVTTDLGLPADTFASKPNWTIPEFKNRLRDALIEIKYFDGLITDVDYSRVWNQIKNNLNDLPSLQQIKIEAYNLLYLEYIRIKNLDLVNFNNIERKIQSFYNATELILKNGYDPNGIFGTTQYAKMVRDMINYTDVSIFKNYKNVTLNRIMNDFYKNNQLDDLMSYMNTNNPNLYNYLVENDLLLINTLATKNKELFEANIKSLTALFTERYDNAISIKDKLAVLSIYKQFGISKFINDKLENINSLKDVLITSLTYFPNNYSKYFLKLALADDTIDALSNSYKLLLYQDHPLFRFSQRFELIYRKSRLIKNIVKPVNNLFKNIIPSKHFLPFELDRPILSIQDIFSILLNFYDNQSITFDDFIDLLFVYYKQSELNLDLDVYVNNALVDIEVYAPSIYKQLQLSNPTTLEFYKTYISRKFNEILMILQVIDPKTSGEHLDNLKLSYNFTFENYINFSVPYELIIKRITELVSNQSKFDIWQAYLDIEPLFIYENFSFEKYFLTLFESVNINPLYKILIILKGIYIINYKDTFIDFIIENKHKITKTNTSGQYIYNQMEDNNYINYEILNLIISKDSSTLFIKKLYEEIYVYDIEPELFYDAIFYHYLNTSYKNIDNVYNKFSTDIANISELYDEDTFPSEEYYLDRMYFNPSFLIYNNNYNTNIYNNSFDYITENIIHYENRIISVKDEDIDEILDGIYNEIDSEKLIETLNLNYNIFISLNVDLQVVLEKSLTKLPSSKLFILLNYIDNLPYSESLNNYFGKNVVDFIFFQIKNDLIYDDLYQLLNQNKIDYVGLYYILGSLALLENTSLDIVGKENPLDTIININLETDIYLSKMKQKILRYSPILHSIIPASLESWKRVLFIHRHYRKLLNIDSDEIKETYESYIQSNKQMITQNNYQGFIDLFILKNIQTPLELMHFLEQYEFSSDLIIDNILKVLKSINKLSKFFYKNWIESVKNPNQIGYEQYGIVVIRNLLLSEFLKEEEVFNFIELLNEPDMFIRQLSYEYTFTQDIKEYKFYRDLNGKSNDFMKSDGLGSFNNPANKFYASRSENLGDILNDLQNYRVELETNSEVNKILETSEQSIDVTKIYTEIFNKIKEEVNEGGKDLTDKEIEELVESKKFANLHDYLKKISKDNGKEIDAYTKEINDAVISVQILLSNLDPTQVLTDALFDDLINNGVLPNTIKEYGVKVENNTFPSFWMAYHIANLLGTRLLERKGSIVTQVTLKQLFTEEVNQFELNTMIDDFDSIMKNEKEKYVFLTKAYVSTLMFTKFIKNNNFISFDPEFSISNESKYKINLIDESPKITASKGGDGMIIIEKI